MVHQRAVLNCAQFNIAIKSDFVTDIFLEIIEAERGGSDSEAHQHWLSTGAYHGLLRRLNYIVYWLPYQS